MVDTMLDLNQRTLLTIIKNALCDNMDAISNVNWSEVEELAVKQGVLWLAYFGVRKTKEILPPERLKAWRAAMHAGVLRNDQINEVQEKFLNWLAKKNIRVAILKGTSCSRHYPYPEARPLGDIDILIEKDSLDIVDDYLKDQGYISSSAEHDFHIGYYGKDAVIEVHYASSSVPNSKGGKYAKEIMKNFLETTQVATVGEMSFPVLSDSHHALMLLLHMERHMLAGGIGLRQLCDWAAFVSSSSSHWQLGTICELDRCGLLTYAKVLTKTCVNYLGVEQNKADWCCDVDDKLTEDMILEVFRGGNLGAAEEMGVGNIFFERSLLGFSGQNTLSGLINKVTNLAFNRYPYVRKYKFMLPFFWIYFPVRYLFRSATGHRPRVSISRDLNTPLRRQRLYKALHLYETK